MLGGLKITNFTYLSHWLACISLKRLAQCQNCSQN